MRATHDFDEQAVLAAYPFPEEVGIGGAEGGLFFPLVMLQDAPPRGDYTVTCTLRAMRLPGQPPYLLVKLEAHEFQLGFRLQASPDIILWVKMMAKVGFFAVHHGPLDTSPRGEFMCISEWDRRVLFGFLDMCVGLEPNMEELRAH